MSKSIVQPHQLDVLFVDCAQDDHCKDSLTDTANLAFFCAPSPSDLKEMMEFKMFDCVMIRVDPGSRESLGQLDVVRNLTIKKGTPMVSLSTLNASWIENLMAQQGVHKHFREFPTHDELSSVLNEFTKPVDGQLRGVAQ